MIDPTAFTAWLGGLGAALSASVVVYGVLNAARSNRSVALLWWSVVAFATGIVLYSIPSFLRGTHGSLMPIRTVGVCLSIAGAVALLVLSRAHTRSGTHVTER
jgi:hypothetical protein